MLLAGEIALELKTLLFQLDASHHHPALELDGFRIKVLAFVLLASLLLGLPIGQLGSELLLALVPVGFPIRPFVGHLLQMVCPLVVVGQFLRGQVGHVAEGQQPQQRQGHDQSGSRPHVFLSFWLKDHHLNVLIIMLRAL